MKLLCLLPLIFIFSCNSKKKSSGSVTPSESKVVAVWTGVDSSKTLGIMLRVIEEGIVYDSLKKEKSISVDTLWGRPILVDEKDSVGNPKVDSLGNKIKTTFYIKINKDSVNWKVQGVPVDSLLKK